jgi:hypothetical protein
MRKLRQLSPLTHAGIALGISIFIYALFTPFPRVLPHPEDFSPTVYLVAFIVTLLSLLFVGTWRNFWRYLPVLLLCTLAFLDEIGYGTEVDWVNVQPLTIERYNVQISDLHNLIGLGGELLQIELQARRWNGPLFEQFGLLAAGLGLFGLAFVAASRLDGTDDQSIQVHKLTKLAAGFWLAAGLAASAWLLALPGDPKNAILFGYSLERLAMTALILVGSAVPLAWLGLEKSRLKLPSLSERLTVDRMSKILRLGALLVLAGIILYAFWAPFVRPPDQRAILERINPLLGWLAAEAWLLILLLAALKGKFNPPLRAALQPVGRFFRVHPAYIYTLIAIGLILGAQIFFDKATVPLDDWLVIPGFWLNGNWELWTEETWEMTAGFLFLVASLTFPRKAESDNPASHSN